MNRGEPESAKICSEYIGKHEVVQANLRYADGALDDAEASETLDYIVQPDDSVSLVSARASSASVSQRQVFT